MKFRNIIFIALIAVLLVASFSDVVLAKEGHKDKGKMMKAQTMCPILTENKINKDKYVDYKGKRIYFCCDGCVNEFKKNPDKYMKQLKEQHIKLADAPKMQTMCPILTDNKINKKLYVDYKGKRVYFCCKGCISAFNKNPEKYIKELKAKNVKLEDAPVKKK